MSMLNRATRLHNFADAIAQFQRRRCSISPAEALNFNAVCIDMIHSDKYGRYHATNEGICSWYDFTCEIMKQAAEYYPNYANVEVSPVSSDAYLTKAKRPHNSRMSKDKLEKKGFFKLPEWQDALKRFLIELKTNETKFFK